MDTHPDPLLPTRLGAHDEQLVDGLAQLWSRAFAGPPWHATPAEVPERRDVIRGQLSRRSTRCFVLADHGELIAAGWTWSGDDSPDDALHRTIRSTIAPDLEQWMFASGTRALVELMVDPDRQSRGHGARLLRALTADAPCWLLTHPEGAGVPLYRRAGWHTHARIRHHDTPLDIMTRHEPSEPLR